jgi:hypothetical protein
MRGECTDSNRHRKTESVLLSGDRGSRMLKMAKKGIQVGVECK